MTPKVFKGLKCIMIDNIFDVVQWIIINPISYTYVCFFYSTQKHVLTSNLGSHQNGVTTHMQHTCKVRKELIVMLALLGTMDIKELAKLYAKY
jgi:hypothetical protein